MPVTQKVLNKVNYLVSWKVSANRRALPANALKSSDDKVLYSNDGDMLLYKKMFYINPMTIRR